MKKEIELKYCLAAKTDFDHFLQFACSLSLKKSRSLKQVNFYFDTPGLNLKKNGLSLRLRQQDQCYFLCAKQSFADKNTANLSVRLEYEAVINNNIAELLKNELLSPIDVFGFLNTQSVNDEKTKKTIYGNMIDKAKTGLQLIGSFSNMRTMVEITIGQEVLILEFDHSFYPQNIEIFEIEVEFSSEKQAARAKPLLEALFRQAGIKTYRSSSKSSRLYKILFG